jgi:hypothetical protein
MATLTLTDSFTEFLPEGHFNLGSDTLKIALTNTAHTATWDTLSDLTEVAYTYCSDRALVITSSSQTSGVYKLILADLVLTATGGAIGPFRYVYIYDDTSTNDDLIGYWDYGSSITLNDLDTITINLDNTNGTLQVTKA